MHRRGTTSTARRSVAPTLHARRNFDPSSACVTVCLYYRHARNASHACAGERLGSGDEDFRRLRRTARASSRGRLATSPPACVALVPCEVAGGSDCFLAAFVHCVVSVYADIATMHQMRRTRLPAKGSASAMKTFQGQDEAHGLWGEVCLLCRGPGRRSGGKGCRREEERERRHRHMARKREE